MEDEDLLVLLDVAITNKVDRLLKSGASASAKSAVVNHIESEVDLVKESSSGGNCSSCCQKSSLPVQKNQPKNDHNPILNKLQEIQVTVNKVATFEDKLEKVDRLEQELVELRKEVGNNPGRRTGGFRYGCDACRAAFKARSCKHCLKCGNEGHKRADCPN